jgi:hypothetical protein
MSGSKLPRLSQLLPSPLRRSAPPPKGPGGQPRSSQPRADMPGTQPREWLRKHCSTPSPAATMSTTSPAPNFSASMTSPPPNPPTSTSSPAMNSPQRPPSPKYGGFTRFEIELEVPIPFPLYSSPNRQLMPAVCPIPRQPRLPAPPRHLKYSKHPRKHRSSNTPPHSPPLHSLPLLPAILVAPAIYEISELPGADAQAFTAFAE